MIVIVLPDIPAEDRLLAQARAGDKSALIQIYESYFPPVYNFIRLRVDDQNLAEDLASTVFVKLVETLRGHNAPQHTLRGWLFRVARNQLSDHFGANRALSIEALEEWLPASPENDPEIQLIQTLNLDLARHALRMLVPDQQEVLMLRLGQSLSLQETADIMGRNVSAIKSLQFRAINTLRQIMSQQQLEHGNG